MLKTPSFAPWLGVFETIRVAEGKALFAAEHWSSLKVAARALRLPIPESRPELPASCKTGRWRWILNAAGLCDQFQREDPPSAKSYTLALAPQRVGSENWDARFKTLSYLTHWQARRAVRADEALLLNEHGELASGAMSNLFWVIGGQVFTPALRAGCRSGVIRRWVLRQERVVEGKFPAVCLDQASGIFVTNSWIGIMPVRQFSGRKIASHHRVEELRGLYARAIARQPS